MRIYSPRAQSSGILGTSPLNEITHRLLGESGAAYPGVQAFYAAFGEPVTFLTVRPSDRAGIVEDDLTYPALKKRGVDDAVVLGIDITEKTDPTYAFVNEKMAAAKGVNFDRFQKLYPEFAIAFVGDNGQGDLAAGRAMWQTAPDAMRAVFIHDLAVGGTKIPDPERKQLAERGVFIFDNYIDAARHAFEAGVINGAALERVTGTALADLKNIPFDSDAQRASREAELRASAQAARAELKTAR